MMPTMQEIDTLELISGGNGQYVASDLLSKLCAAARRGVEADAEVRRVESILSNDIRNLTEKVIPNITERAEKAEAELAALKMERDEAVRSRDECYTALGRNRTWYLSVIAAVKNAIESNDQRAEQSGPHPKGESDE